MMRLDKTIGRLIAVLVDAGIIERKQAVWILEPLKDTTVDAEPVRHGKWIYHVDSESTGDTWICSKCNGEEFCKTKFCPHCGARMDAEREE